MEDALEGEPGRAGERAGGYARLHHLRGLCGLQARVGVPADPGRVVGELLDEREGGAVGADARLHVGVGGGTGLGEGFGDEGEAHEGAEGEPDEEEGGAVEEAAPALSRWGFRGCVCVRVDSGLAHDGSDGDGFLVLGGVGGASSRDAEESGAM